MATGQRVQRIHAQEAPSAGAVPSRPDENTLSSQEYFLRNWNKSAPASRQEPQRPS